MLVLARCQNARPPSVDRVPRNAGSGLLGLSGEAQSKMLRWIDDLVNKSRADGQFHTMVHGYAGLWRYPTLFAASFPRSMPNLEARDRLEKYLRAKKHQLRSDRSLGVLVSDVGLPVDVVYDNSPWSEDPELDALGEEIGLQPPPGTPKRPPTNTRPLTVAVDIASSWPPAGKSQWPPTCERRNPSSGVTK